MRTGFVRSSTGTAALIVAAGGGLVLPLLLSGWHAGVALTAVDLVGRAVAFAALVMLATRRLPRETHAVASPGSAKAPGQDEYLDALRLELARLQRFARPFALVSIHCDGAAVVRDRESPRAAAELMAHAADTIARNVRRTDFSAVVDAGSFGILLPETDASTAGIVVDQLRDRLKQAMRERHWPTSSSIGVAVFTRPVDSLDTALARAEELMTRVRSRGQNGLLIETDGLRQRDAEALVA
jgi:diguanylate cyclase (GGDEF)-like protein